MHNDEKMLVEAYSLMSEKAEHCKYAVDGCECGECIECSEHKASQTQEPGNNQKDNKTKQSKKQVKEAFVPSEHTNKFEEAYSDILRWFED